MQKTKRILGIDPGLKGAFVLMSENEVQFSPMPINPAGDIDFNRIQEILDRTNPSMIFLERAVSFGMGITGAFNYGRGFAALEIAIGLSGRAVTYIEPKKWAKVMHNGIDSNYKPKVKSEIAIQRLFPTLCDKLPKNSKGKIPDGFIDAVLIAGFGSREMGLHIDFSEITCHDLSIG